MKFIHGTRKDFIDRAKGKKIICFGASKQFTEAVIDLKRDFSILDYIEAIVDNSTKKIGGMIEIEGYHFQIFGSEYFQEECKEERILLITSRYYYEIVQQLEKLEGWDNTEVFAYACMVLDRELEEESRYKIRIIEQAILEYKEYLDACCIELNYKKEKFEIMETYIRNQLYRVLPSVVLMHSNICTLKCEQCCDLIPLVREPYYMEANKILKSLDLLLRGVDKCIRVDLTDGETFLYKELDILLDNLIRNEKVETILIVTNGTILPSKKILELLRHEKCFVTISDYGLLEQMSKLVVLLEQYHINFSVLTNMKWRNFKQNKIENIRKRKEEKEWLQYEFLRCGNKKCSKALIENRFYGCMPAFRFANIGIFESVNDYVELSEKDSEDEIWEKIKRVCMLDFIDACQYCNFENTSIPFCRAGAQNGLIQSEYTLIKRSGL